MGSDMLMVMKTQVGSSVRRRVWKRSGWEEFSKSLATSCVWAACRLKEMGKFPSVVSRSSILAGLILLPKPWYISKSSLLSFKHLSDTLLKQKTSLLWTLSWAVQTYKDFISSTRHVCTHSHHLQYSSKDIQPNNNSYCQNFEWDINETTSSCLN